MSKVVIIGAGQTGRGYLNRFFQSETITFLDKDESLIRELQKETGYTVFFGKESGKKLFLNNYHAYLIDSEEGKCAMSEADLIIISVRKENLKAVAEEIQKALARRTKGDLDILTAENGVNVKADILGLCQDKRVHLAESIVFCTTVGEKDTLDILSQDLDYMPYDVTGLGHELHWPNMEAEKNLDVLMQRKIYTYNCISAVVSYLGYYKKYEIYADAANDEEIAKCCEDILGVLNHCVCAEYQVSEEEQKRFAKMAVDKFQNRNIIDSIERNVRDADRKLGASERIMKPLAMIQKYGKSSPALLLTAAGALYYGKVTDTLKKTEQAYLEKLPTEWIEECLGYLKALENGKTITEILA